MIIASGRFSTTRKVFPRTFSTSAALALANDYHHQPPSSSVPPAIKWMNKQIASGEEDAFYIVDTDAVKQQYTKWNHYLPNIKPFYAVKCNPDPAILKTLANLGCGFDCASREEMKLALNLTHSENIIYANPCKQVSHLRYAAASDVRRMTFDSVEELEKVAKFAPQSELVLRLLVDDSHSQCQLGTKFGAPLSEVPVLLRRASQLKLNVIGISFHVGSGCYDTSAYTTAIQDSKSAFDIGRQFGHDFTLLDIGGGFPGSDNTDNSISFPDIAAAVRDELHHSFSKLLDSIEIIAEPGRFFAESSHTLAVSVIGRKATTERTDTASKNNNATTTRPSVKMMSSCSTREMQTNANVCTENTQYMYYINDGLYGSFNCLMYDHASVSPQVLNNDTNPSSSSPQYYTSSVWGPTCDGLDCILKAIRLPKLEVGEWLYFNNMGAYTSAAGSSFNGFERPSKYYI